MIVYYSGAGCPASNPENVLGSRGHLMLTYADFPNNRPTARFRSFTQMPVTDRGQMFLDSGAFTLARHYGNRLSSFFGKDGLRYVDNYAAFVRRYLHRGVDLYANVDVIGDADLTWRNQVYLERVHNLRPVPVVHCRSGVKWLRRYLDDGHELIGLGGLVGRGATQRNEWLTKCFAYLRDSSTGLPRVKVHCFGVTDVKYLLRYPFHSSDSATWCKVAARGHVLLPQWHDVHRFDRIPHLRHVSDEHAIATMKPKQFAALQRWLHLIGLPLPDRDEDGAVVGESVLSQHIHRRVANLHYFDRLAASLTVAPAFSVPAES